MEKTRKVETITTVSGNEYIIITDVDGKKYQVLTGIDGNKYEFPITDFDLDNILFEVENEIDFLSYHNNKKVNKSMTQEEINALDDDFISLDDEEYKREHEQELEYLKTLKRVN